MGILQKIRFGEGAKSQEPEFVRWPVSGNAHARERNEGCTERRSDRSSKRFSASASECNARAIRKSGKKSGGKTKENCVFGKSCVGLLALEHHESIRIFYIFKKETDVAENCHRKILARPLRASGKRSIVSFRASGSRSFMGGSGAFFSATDATALRLSHCRSMNSAGNAVTVRGAIRHRPLRSDAQNPPGSPPLHADRNDDHSAITADQHRRRQRSNREGRHVARGKESAGKTDQVRVGSLEMHPPLTGNERQPFGEHQRITEICTVALWTWTTVPSFLDPDTGRYVRDRSRGSLCRSDTETMSKRRKSGATAICRCPESFFWYAFFPSV